MSRIYLMLAVAVTAGFAGCAVCDTCDDFPVPCIGPNCGQLMPGGIPGYFGDAMGPQAAQADAVMGTSTPVMPAPPAVNPGPMAPGGRAY